jgi:hypothetical protein
MKIMFVIQAVILIGFVLGIYFLYPRTDVEVNKDIVNFKKINANVIIISENPDFTNPRYLDFEDRENISFSLKPGIYYWKASNKYIEGLGKEFTINSEVGMKVEVGEEGSRVVNVGNVILDVKKDENGKMVGHVILDTGASDEINNSGVYTGRQA